MKIAIMAGLALALGSGFAASAETMTYKAKLDSVSEVPPTDSKGTGDLTATYDSTTKMMTVQGHIMGLTGEATAAHFHGPAEPGKNAGVLIPVAGVKNDADFKGSMTLTDAQAAALTGGMTYFNVHTAKNPNGEVRGQVTK